MDKESLSLMIGRTVRINRGGPESKKGKLFSAKDDHIVVDIENEGMLYCKMDHIKSLTLDARDVSDLTEVPPTPVEEQVVLPKYIDAEDFYSVMENMKYRWVQINRGGPEKTEGVLVETTADQIRMVVGNEVVHILPFHIRNISYGLKKNDQDNNKDKQDGNKDAKDGNKDAKK
ncbi:spore coat protein [Paenibacillus radicis (ex Xue et al. 2023)]|uniref:Spore coat protein n=1 Tax=Paenibacillus radicis (ex Xue et al. 2023) TaxID=2972489 RepID=A0ABT1YDR5_9BACL|nr:spore coat protein [Paenibacillus radicis (ex Xue et al. 2023)]MCR8630905.1 spore coat protein [Paenibacillus radicis (ex Xue et al. 2023)]